MALPANATTILTQGRPAPFGRLLLFLFGVAVLATGCAHYPVNEKLATYQPPRITIESTALLRRMVKDWSFFRQMEVPYEAPHYYVTEVSFHALPNMAERAGFVDMPTSFNLSDEDVDRLRDAAKRILYN